MTAITSEALLPCPHCGGKAKHGDADLGGKITSHWYECEDCTETYANEAEARAAWNRRALIDQQSARLAAAASARVQWLALLNEALVKLHEAGVDVPNALNDMATKAKAVVEGAGDVG